MKKKLKLYLAHNLDRRHEAREKELDLEKRYNLELVNPFYDTKRTDIKQIDAGKASRWELDNDRCKKIVENDLGAIDECEGILAIIVEPSIGTTLEIGYARQTKKKIFIISEKYIDHPWLKVYATMLFRNFDEFEKYLFSCGLERDENEMR